MQPDGSSIWIWLFGIAAAWLFLGLVAGRFSALRNRLVAPQRPSGVTPPGRASTHT